jgi:hypothetical protein
MAGSKRLKGWQMTADIFIYIAAEKVKKVVIGLLFESRGSGTRWTDIKEKSRNEMCREEMYKRAMG